MKEAKVENHLRKALAEVGALCEKHVAPGRRGVPDDLVTWPWGEMDLVETKCPGGKCKPWQTRDHEARAARGVPVYLLDTIGKVEVYIAARLARVTPRRYFSVPTRE